MSNDQNQAQIRLSNGFLFTQIEGEWIYKAENIPFKKKVIERPPYKVIEEIEENYLKYFQEMLDYAANEIKNEI